MHSDYLPMNAATLMDRVFELYKATFKTQIAFSLIIGIISFIMMIVLGISLVFVLGVAVGFGGAYVDDIYILITVAVVLIGILPLYMAWLHLSASGHILLSKQAFYGEAVELPFRDIFSAFLRIISAGLAQIILSLPWLALLILIIYAAVSGHDDAFGFVYTINPAVLIVGGLVYAFLYVAYSNIFALSIPVAIFEKRFFFATIRRSYQLLKGDFWKVLGLRLLWALLTMLFSYSAQGLIVALVGGIALAMGTVIDIGELWFATGGMQFYATLFVGILVGPMEGIMTALIYFNQKIKKDGLDIEIGIEQLARGYNP